LEIKVDGYLYNNGHPVEKNLKDVKVYEYNIEENNFEFSIKNDFFLSVFAPLREGLE